MSEMNKHSIRVRAMRLANVLSTFDRSEFKTKWHKINRGFEQRQIDDVDMSKWAFVDLDPLLGQVDEFLRDDGARATWPLDFALSYPVEDDPAGFQISNFRSIKPKEARECRIFSPKMLKCEMVKFRDGTFSTGGTVVSLIGGKWVEALRGPITSQNAFIGHGSGNLKPVSPLIGDVAAGAALRHRYEWSAIFTFPGGLNLRFGTTADGVLALFRDRQRADGEVRRAALLHWVRRHWKRGVSSSAAMIEIRKHLRGKEQFTWHGLSTVVVPAEYEIETAQ